MTSQTYTLDGPKSFTFAHPVRYPGQLTVEVSPGGVVPSSSYEVVGYGPRATQVTIEYPDAPSDGESELIITRFTEPERVATFEDDTGVTARALNAEFDNVYQSLDDFTTAFGTLEPVYNKTNLLENPGYVAVSQDGTLVLKQPADVDFGDDVEAMFGDKEDLSLLQFQGGAIVDGPLVGTEAGQVPTNADLPNSDSVGTEQNQLPKNSDLYRITTKDVAGGTDVTLTETEAQARVLVFTGTLTGDINVVVPNTPHLWLVKNSTSGSFDLTVKTSAGSGAAVPQGEEYGLRSDGTNVIRIAAVAVDSDALQGSVPGSNPGDLVQFEDDGEGDPRYPAGDGSQFINLPVSKSESPERTHLELIWGSWGSNATGSTYNQIISYNGNQYIAYWNRMDQLIIGKRAHESKSWELSAVSGVTIPTKDSHWTCSIGIDSNGRILIAYNVRNSTITWRYSTNPEDIQSWSSEQVGMTGQNESSASYPAFWTGPNGKIVFSYREGESGDGDQMLNEWDPDTLTWSVLQHPFIQGTTASPTVNPYLWNPPYMQDGALHVFWSWRETSSVETSHDLMYVRSFDGGTTWERADGTAQTLPITPSNADVVKSIPQNSNYGGAAGSIASEDGTPHTMFIIDDANGIPQMYYIYYDGVAWQEEQISHRRYDFDQSGTGNIIMPIAPSGMELYDDGGILLFTRDVEFGNGLIFYYRDPDSQSWQLWNPMLKNLVGWRPQWDRSYFRQTGKLDLIVTPIADAYTEELEHRVPLEIWRFRSLAAIPRTYAPVFKTLASASPAPGGSAVTSTSTTYEEESISIAVSAAAFDGQPTHARIVARVRNNTTTDPVYIRNLIVDDAEGDVRQSYGEAAMPSGLSSGTIYMLDTGWQAIPRANGNPIRFGYAGLEMKVDGGEGQLLSWTLMIGTQLLGE